MISGNFYRMNRYARTLAAAVCSVALIAIAGCDSGPPTGDVTGTVTMDGKPLTNAIVSFVPQSGGQTAIGKTDSAGKYELYRRGERGALLGTHTVVITTVQEPVAAAPSMSSDSEEYLKQASGGNPSDYNQAIVKEPIPARYNKQSTLTMEVSKGKNTIDLELTSD
mgnify:FL=1